MTHTHRLTRNPIAAWEESSMAAYQNYLDAHDRREMAIEREFRFLNECAMVLRVALNGVMNEGLDTLLWAAAEARIETLAKTTSED